MTTKSLKKFTELLNRSEGISLTPIIVIMVIMSVMGGVFTSIMGGWKVSAPLTMNSSKAFFQAETAAMFALQEAKYRFYSKDPGGIDLFNFGDRNTPFVVSSVTTGNVTEVADYWFEMPNSADDVTTGTNDDVVDDDDDDSNSADDLDGDGVSDRYTIIATGRVDIGGTTLAKRQIKVLADIIPSPADTVEPGVQTSVLGSGGGILGTAAGFGISFGGTVTYDNGGLNSISSGGEAGIVIRPAQTFQTFDEDFVKALATDQGHFNAGNLTVGSPDYPTASFYYDFPTNNMPNFTYVGLDLTINGGNNANGVIWVKGNIILNNTLTMNAIIICEGNIDFIGIASNINGGIIHLGNGVITGNNNANAIVVNQAFFDDLNATIPIIDIDSWQEAVSAN